MTNHGDEGSRPPGRAEARSWVATTEGSHLRGRRTRDTAPEVALRRAVHALGLRYRLGRTLFNRCRPDLAFPGPRVAVFVDGCFWHGCPQHGPSRFRGPNADRWAAKIETNRQRDQRVDKELVEAGWRVVRVWECEVRQEVGGAARRVAGVVRDSSRPNPLPAGPTARRPPGRHAAPD
ncbi:very short patch repair endonuclease [Salinispora tropica]|uniref:DNA mismatch endonuclease vsr n=1 Tax=Salinispora tropica (strain ATCC BAA-916 / DSM 44818 / JCM 13857 / NBRC 105044 / CNB-440) TaxID=369723 RepID=A4X2E7_SALTO|nr:very short patch repair endonuclease [Salinispora tropica]ABP53047.1 DNA mismatch endonuclease vsr [Salinispora tropica CNB-440]